ncbi:MAG: DUF6790 family protein [Devosia sp.]
MLYLFATWGLMVIIPALSVLIETLVNQPADFVWLVAKWFVFWGVGIRLLTAGIRQVAQPGFTAKSIFKMDNPDAEKLVTEIGFGNLAMGGIATLSLVFPAWAVPAGLIGALYLGLAGVKHVFNANRSGEENTALITDIILGVVVIASTLIVLFR